MSEMTLHTSLPGQYETVQLSTLALRVSNTEMIPTQYRGKPDAVLACFIAGREIGLSPMESVRSFHIIEGKPSMSAELMHTLALRAGHDIWIVEADRKGCTVRCHHRDWPQDRTIDVRWDEEDAQAAGLVGKGNWKKYARAMFRSRAVSEAIRQVCPEVLVGATYTAEELGARVEGPFATPEGRTDHDWVGDADPEIIEVTADLVEDSDEIIEAEVVEPEVEAAPPAKKKAPAKRKSRAKKPAVQVNDDPTLDDFLGIFDPEFLAGVDLSAAREHSKRGADQLAQTLSVLEKRQAQWEVDGRPDPKASESPSKADKQEEVGTVEDAVIVDDVPSGTSSTGTEQEIVVDAQEVWDSTGDEATLDVGAA
jgi:hypothetical protein